MQKPIFLRAFLAVLATAFLFSGAPGQAQEWQDANGKVYQVESGPNASASTWQDANGKVYSVQPAPNTSPAPQNAPQYAQQQGAPAQADGDYGYVLDSGDKIRVNVFGEDKLSGDFEVDGTGLVRLPMIGTLRVGGLTAPAAEGAITQALKAGYLNNPRVTVSVASYRPFFILGEVNKPGEYPYVNNMNALNAVALAGGYTGRAVTSTIYIQRQGQTAERGYPADQRTRIYPGDVVRVEDTVFWRIMSYAVPLSTFRPY